MSEIHEENKTTTPKSKKLGFWSLVKAIPLWVKIILVLIVLSVLTVNLMVTKHDDSDAVKYGVTLQSEVVSTSSQKTTPVSIPDQLTNVQAQLADIVTLVSNSQDTADMKAIKTALSGLSEQVGSIKTEEQNRYNAIMAQYTALTQQLIANQKETNKNFTNLEAIDQHKKCYPASKLPFTVRSIDLINGRVVVSVFYDTMVTPLEKNFTLAGWQLSNANYTTQVATFVDAKGICAQSNLNSNF